MECGIDKWGTSIKTDVAFTAVDYCTMFNMHLQYLCDFKEATKKYELLDKICTRLCNIGQYIISLFIDQLSDFGLVLFRYSTDCLCCCCSCLCQYLCSHSEGIQEEFRHQDRQRGWHVNYYGHNFYTLYTPLGK